MRKLYKLWLSAFVILALTTVRTNAQTANNYVYTTGLNAALDPMTGATQILGASNDDSPSSLTAIGFNFVYEGVTYTDFSITPDGFVKLGSPVAVSQFSNSITSTTNVPKVAVFWDDLATGTNGFANYVVTGTAPNRILKINWFVTIPRNTSGAANSTFQCWLYETSNVIEFRYGVVGGTTSSASIGIVGATATNFISLTTPSNASSTTTANNSNTAWPGTGRSYIFTPPAAACSGTPAPGTISGSSAICSGKTDTLTLAGFSFPQSGIGIQWKSSTTSGGPYTNAANGTTNILITPALSVPTYFVAVVTCANGGASATSPEFAVSLNPAPAIGVTPTTATLCNGGTLALAANGGLSYTWSPATGLSGTTGANVFATGTSNVGSTVYTVTGTGANGCTNTATATINFSPTPSATASATIPSVCINGVTQLNAVGAIPATANNYSFTTGTGSTLDPMTGATTLITTNDDDTPNASPFNIGFTFNFSGVDYTQFSVSPDGWILLGNTIASSQFTNAVTSTTNIPKIYPYWDDVATGSNGYVKGVVTGSAPNRILKIEWFVTIPRNTAGAANSTFQAWLYEGTGRIEFRYGTMGPGTMSASVGLTASATIFHSATIASGTSSTTTANDVNPDQPATGTIYIYAPPSPPLTWYPVNDLYTDALATNAYTGTAATTVYAKPTTSRTYSVTGTSAGCTGVGEVTILANQTPAAPVITPASATICNGNVQQLTAASANTATKAQGASGAVSVQVPDNTPGGISNNVTISGIPAGAVIVNAEVRINMAHTSDGDMVFNLKAPNGNVLNLINLRGGTGDNFTGTLIGSAGLPSLATGTAPFTGAFAPDAFPAVGPPTATSNVGTFVGLYSVPNGTWTLAMQDNGNNGEVGLLKSWSITLYYYATDVITWSPLTSLFTNLGGTNPYTGTNLATVYAKPANTSIFTATAATPGCTSANGNVTVTVNQLPAINGQPATQSLCPGNTAVFTVGATGTGLTYQWRKGGVNLNNGGNISGATSNQLTVSNLTVADAGNYDVVVSGACPPNVTSNVAVLSVGAAPLITTQPVAQVFACAGNSFSLKVVAGGVGLTYQWRKGGVNLNNGGNISGATSNTLTVSNASATDAGTYDVVVTNTCAQSSTSTSTTVTFSTADRWLGASNSDWNNPANWCNGVPTSTTDVVIPSGTLFPANLTVNASVRDLTINSGATLTVAPSGWLDIYGTNLVTTGTLNATAGTLGFRNTANLNVPAITANNVVMNGTGGITLNGNMTINVALTLTTGNITLGSNNLVLTGGTNGSAASHVVTNGSGVMTNNTINTATAIFPVGPTATSYNPVWIANGQGLNYSVRVATGVPGTLVNGARAINRTWTVSASGVPANNVSITFGYADADANASCTPTANMEIGYLNGSTWSILTPAGGVVPTGTATNRLAATITKTFGTMVVANVGGINNPTATPNLDADLYDVRMMPNIVQQQALLRVQSRRAMNVEWTVTDLQGRVVMKLNHGVLAGQNDINLRLGHLASGTYQIVGYTNKGQTNVVKFVRL